MEIDARLVSRARRLAAAGGGEGERAVACRGKTRPAAQTRAPPPAPPPAASRPRCRPRGRRCSPRGRPAVDASAAGREERVCERKSGAARLCVRAGRHCSAKRREARPREEWRAGESRRRHARRGAAKELRAEKVLAVRAPRQLDGAVVDGGAVEHHAEAEELEVRAAVPRLAVRAVRGMEDVQVAHPDCDRPEVVEDRVPDRG
mmetsp:Transcript_30749/g.98110  ORF Transcript_30749/g.98110 Transcript_30749/m.98110 type:complete len:204 (-) Transcript_30749:945-1556(-)